MAKLDGIDGEYRPGLTLLLNMVVMVLGILFPLMRINITM